jgi:hypothetical protein
MTCPTQLVCALEDERLSPNTGYLLCLDEVRQIKDLMEWMGLVVGGRWSVVNE